MSAFEGAPALAAALMLAASPITGDCTARVMTLCTGDGETRIMLVWDEGSPPARPNTPSAGKACHACLPNKRKAQAGLVEQDADI